MSTDNTKSEAPRRGRPPRAEVVAGERRRRRGGTLNRMGQYKLDIIDPALLDLDNVVYRWINDTPGRLRMATKMDDYEPVPASELGSGFSIETTDSEGGEHVRNYAGLEGGQPIYAHLCKKPREFWEEDNEEVVARREAMMAGRVYRAEASESGDFEGQGGRDLDESAGAYIPKGVSVKIGGAAARKRGPIANFR